MVRYRLYIVNQPHFFGRRDDVDVFNPVNRTGILSDGTRFMVVKPIADEIRDKITGIDLESVIFVENLFQLTTEMMNLIKPRVKNDYARFELL